MRKTSASIGKKKSANENLASSKAFWRRPMMYSNLGTFDNWQLDRIQWQWLHSFDCSQPHKSRIQIHLNHAEQQEKILKRTKKNYERPNLSSVQATEGSRLQSSTWHSTRHSTKIWLYLNFRVSFLYFKLQGTKSTSGLFGLRLAHQNLWWCRDIASLLTFFQPRIVGFEDWNP